MSEIKITKIKDEVFGNLVHITNGIVELAASLDFGPRVLRYNICGKENIFYNDLEMKDISDVSYPEYEGGILKTYGGHRLWISPEILPRCYYPDNFPVTLREKSNGVCLTAPVEKYNNIQKTIYIELNEYNAEITVIGEVSNKGAWDIVAAPWAITVMSQGGVEVLPQADSQTGLLGNRIIGLWPYTKLNDERVYWGEKYIVLKQDTSVDRAFKIGVNNEKGWAAYFNKGQMFVKRHAHFQENVYPDFNCCSFETYTNKEVLEMETIGGTEIIPPGGSVLHKELWSLFNESFVPGTNEARISEVIEKYI